MDPRWLFPWLAAGLVVAALVRGLSGAGWRGSTRTWLLLAVLFGGVSLWLRFQG